MAPLNRRDLGRNLLTSAVLGGALGSVSAAKAKDPARRLTLMDGVHFNPGEPYPDTRYLKPGALVDLGFDSMLIFEPFEIVPTFGETDPGLLGPGDPETLWAEEKARGLDERVRAAAAAGLKPLAFCQFTVLPKRIAAKHRDEISDAKGRIDLSRPMTQHLLRAQVTEIFRRFPALDGIVVRTGEIYLHGFPHHQARADTEGEIKAQNGTAIIHGVASHRQLIELLRQVVCVEHGRRLIYRTWDLGGSAFDIDYAGTKFHTNPRYYTAVTDPIAPHPKLFLSIKHQRGDFQQLTPINPTIGIGRHGQIIEVQAQREAYGKGAHPYYIGGGVIDGWEEYAWMMYPQDPHGLRQLLRMAQVRGVWTWSRGGGWDGPSIPNEFWCDLNLFVVSQYARDPARSEADIFADFASRVGLGGGQLAGFRELALLSTKAVLRGQLTNLGVDMDLWWARDDTMAAPDLSDFVTKGLTEAAISEKREAVAMWRRIETLASGLRSGDATRDSFLKVSCAYGRIKYAIFAEAWTALLLSLQAASDGGAFDRQRVRAALASYDGLWDEWRALKASHADCPTLHSDLRGRYGKADLRDAIDAVRRQAA